MKVLLAAPFDTKGRYNGGIAAVVKSVCSDKQNLDKNRMHIVPFETCRINRKKTGDTKISFSNIKNFLSIYRNLCKDAINEKPDIVYYHTSIGLALLKDLIAIKHMKKRTNVRVCIHIHFAGFETIVTNHIIIRKEILSLIRTYVDHVIFLSKKTQDDFIANGISPAKCSVVYNFSTMNLDAKQVESQITCPHDVLRLLFVGSLDERKGIIDLMKALDEMKSDQLLLNVCGGFTNETTEKEFYSYQKKLGSKIIFKGYVSGEEKEQIFLNSDVLVLPSYGEGLPIVIMEAFNAGCAVISTNVGAIPEIVTSDNGRLIEPGDIEKLKTNIQVLLADNELLQKMQMTNRRMSDEYSLEKFISSVAKIFENMMTA